MPGGRRMEGASRREPRDHLPVRPTAFAVMLALVDEARAGFEIMERANEALPGVPILGPGSLYRILRELRREGLVQRVEPSPHQREAGDERRQYHGLTGLGRAVVRAEADRLGRAMELAGLSSSEEGP